MAKQEYTTEQLQHYLTHPEEVDATDAELVNKLAAMELPDDMGAALLKREIKATDEDAEATERDDPAENAKEAKAAVEEAERKAVEGSEKSGKETAEEAQTEGDKPEDKPHLVLTKDGKHALPWSVVESAREENKALKTALDESQRNLLALSAKLTGKAAPTGRESPDHVQQALHALRSELPKVQEDAPWLADTLNKTVAAIDLIARQQAELVGARAQDDNATREELEMSAAEALESNPTLVLWRSQAPALFDEAVRMDEHIRRDPQLRERYETFEDRFAAAVRMVSAHHEGEELPLPEAVSEAKEVKQQPRVQTAKPSTSDVTTRAKAVIDKATTESVRTLSDMPGGAGEMTAQEALEGKSALEISRMFDGKTPQQIVDWAMTHG